MDQRCGMTPDDGGAVTSVRVPPTAQASAVYPLKAASIVAMSIFVIGIIASKARLAAAVSRLVVASSRARGGICQEKPHRSLPQLQALSSPPLSMIAFQ